MRACIFHDVNPGQRDRKLFEIVEYAYNQRARVVIYAPNEARAAVIDRFLWILRQESFMPHKIILKDEAGSLGSDCHRNRRNQSGRRERSNRRWPLQPGICCRF